MRTKSKVYRIYLCKVHTHDKLEVMGEYYNRGHVVAALRGFRRRAWQAGSEAVYHLSEG